MKRNHKIMLSAFLLLVILLVNLYNNRSVGFHEVVTASLKPEDVASIQIVSISGEVENETNITGSHEIASILDQLIQLKVRKISSVDNDPSDDIRIMIRSNNGAKYLFLTVYDKSYIHVYDDNRKKNKIKNYKIVSDNAHLIRLLEP
ncbi:DUF5301 domain-containing protein [Paenibacillus sp. NPDC058174]|uniref:DUF5301 domain-containing protein n=1 Tax=Paenibacillus sp. NPDC058174 TaxID=3346366 RepID=UPI0036DE6B0B